MALLSSKFITFLTRRGPIPFLPRWGFYLICLSAFVVIDCHVVIHLLCRKVQVEADGANPAIKGVAAAIAEMKQSPSERAALVGYAAAHLIEYENGQNVYGSTLVPGLDTVFATRRENHWLYPRGDCKTMALVAGSMLSALGISWEAVANPVIGHMWVRVHINGASFDILSSDPSVGDKPWKNGLAAVSGLLGFAMPKSPPPIPAGSFVLAVPAYKRNVATHSYFHDVLMVGAFYLDGAKTKVHQPLNFDHPSGQWAFLERSRSSASMAGFPFGETR